MSLLDEQTWGRAKRLFAEASELPPGEREAFLDEACGGDARLRAETASLLKAHDRNRDDTAFRSPFREGDPTPDPLLGRRVGAYRLDRVLGTGGMGSVYLGVRDAGDFEQQVAIKFVRGVDPEAVQRFHTERRILAGLEHPHIARLLGGGVTDDGHPFLLMEFVSGEPLTTYCRQHDLPLEDRLRLMEDICVAVQYAHSRLVVHRDLKPSNILVTEGGVVKLLDFGIAKLLDQEAADVTRVGSRAMTPDYASPEQILGQTVTTQSDVYALGVLLYELLTGQPPYRTADLTPREMERTVCETVPPRPSSVAAVPWAHRLRGDLDTITAAAMHRDLERRFGSARELAEDLRRYREGKPVASRGDGAAYRFGKFLARNRVGVVTAGLFLILLVTGIITTTRQARIAQRRLEAGRELAGKLLLGVHEGMRDLHGSTRVREELVANTLGYLDVLAADSGDDPALLRDMAAAYVLVADLQGNPNEDNLGDLGGAIESYRKAVAIGEAIHRNDLEDGAAARDLARAYGQLAVALSYSGQSTDAIALGDSALGLLAPLLPGDPELQRTEARIRGERAWLQVWEGDPAGPRPDLLAAESRLQALAAADSTNLGVHIDLWRTHYYLGDSFLSEGDNQGALTWLKKGEQALADLETRFPDNPRVLRGRMGCTKRLGDVWARMNEPDRALEAYRKSLEVSAHLAAGNPDNRTAQRGLGFAYNALGAYLVQLGRAREGIETIGKAVEIRVKLTEEDAENVSDINDLSVTQLRLADAYMGLGELDQALRSCDSARDYHQRLPESDRNNPNHMGNLAAIEATRGMALRMVADASTDPEIQEHRRRDAVASYETALDLFDRIQAGGSSIDLWRDDIRVIQKEVEALHAAIDAAEASP